MSGAELRARLSGPAGSPAVAIAVTDAVTDEELAAAVSAGATVIELRIDRFASTDPASVRSVARRVAAHAPALATVRSAAEGGGWTADDGARLAVIEQVLPEVSGVDIELSSGLIVGEVVEVARELDLPVVVSFHDFAATPSSAELEDFLDGAYDAGAELAKVAVLASSAADLRTLADLVVRHHERGLAVLGMGPLGPASRILLPFLGSRLTFAASESAPAPGQLPLADTVALLERLRPSGGGVSGA